MGPGHWLTALLANKGQRSKVTDITTLEESSNTEDLHIGVCRCGKQARAESHGNRASVNEHHLRATPVSIPTEELFRGARDRCSTQLTLISASATGFAPFPRLEASPCLPQLINPVMPTVSYLICKLLRSLNYQLNC